jgi:hypothetical protein
MMLALAAAMCAAGAGLLGWWAVDQTKRSNNAPSATASIALPGGPGLSPETVAGSVETMTPDEGRNDIHR